MDVMDLREQTRALLSAGYAPLKGESEAAYVSRNWASFQAGGVGGNGSLQALTTYFGSGAATSGAGIGTSLGIGELKPGDDPTPGAGFSNMAEAIMGGAGVATTILTGLGVTTGTILTAGAIFDALTVMPWNTGPGEGVIAAWTPKKQNEAGLWVTPKTRPDLFTPAEAGRMAGYLNGGGGLPVADAGAGFAGGAIAGGTGVAAPNGSRIVSSWNTKKDGSGWTFYRLANGKLATYNKYGVWREWKPKKPIVLVRGKTTLSQAVKAERYLNRLFRTIAKRTKALKLA